MIEMTMNRTITAAMIFAILACTWPVRAQNAPNPGGGLKVVAGEPRWIVIETRTVTPQLLKQSFALAELRGRFREFRVEAEQGTVEIARTVVDFADKRQVISNRLSILEPKGAIHEIQIGGIDLAVLDLSLITATARGKSQVGRITLYGLHVPEVIVPPLPQRAGS
ncbi:MAG: hypothetical protein AB7U75_06115 [Hyphomicrobiaceae bacterium]